MNLDDFVEVCRLVGAKPHYTVRLTDATPEDAAALVEYANGGVDTTWGFMRAVRGHAAPYGIRRWYVGNEIYPFVPGMKDPVLAAQRTMEIARAMKRADPTVELVPSNWALSDWNARFLEELERLGGAEVLSLVSYHQYLLDVMQNFGDALVVEHPEDPITPEQIETCLRAPVDVILPRMRAVRSEMQAAGTGMGALSLTMDEWNFYWNRPGHPALALYMMGIFNVLVRTGEETGIRSAMFFHPVNEGLLRVTSDGTFLEDGARAWMLARSHGGRCALEVTGVEGGALDAAASTDGDSVYITLVNRSCTDFAEVTIPRMAEASLIQTECWAAENPQTDMMRPGSLRMCALHAGDGAKLILPPASMAGVWLR